MQKPHVRMTPTRQWPPAIASCLRSLPGHSMSGLRRGSSFDSIRSFAHGWHVGWLPSQHHHIRQIRQFLASFTGSARDPQRPTDKSRKGPCRIRTGQTPRALGGLRMVLCPIRHLTLQIGSANCRITASPVPWKPVFSDRLFMIYLILFRGSEMPTSGSSPADPPHPPSPLVAVMSRSG